MGAERKEMAELNVDILKTAVKKIEVQGNYTLSPHFLVKIFAIAEKNQAAKGVLKQKGFYAGDRYKRLALAIDPEFLAAITDNEIEELLSVESYKCFEDIGKILRINGPFSSENWNDLRRFSKNNAALQAIVNKYDPSNPFPPDFSNPFPPSLPPISHPYPNLDPAVFLKEAFIKGFKKILRDQYIKYAKSEEVAEETRNGTCIDIIRYSDDPYEQNEEEAQKYGHWKLHISIDMDKNSQDKIDKAYNELLSIAEKHGINELKVVAPFRSVNSMKDRELTVYLSNEAPKNTPNIHSFIAEVENAFSTIKVIPRKHEEAANKQINKSTYFSFRNERAKKDSQEGLEDNDYIDAGKAKAIAKRRGTDPHNPFGYEDIFGLGALNLKQIQQARQRSQASKVVESVEMKTKEEIEKLADKLQVAGIDKDSIKTKNSKNGFYLVITILDNLELVKKTLGAALDENSLSADLAPPARPEQYGESQALSSQANIRAFAQQRGIKAQPLTHPSALTFSSDALPRPEAGARAPAPISGPAAPEIGRAPPPLPPVSRPPAPSELPRFGVVPAEENINLNWGDEVAVAPEGGGPPNSEDNHQVEPGRHKRRKK